MIPNVADVQVGLEQYRERLREAEKERLIAKAGLRGPGIAQAVWNTAENGLRVAACRFTPLQNTAMCRLPA